MRAWKTKLLAVQKYLMVRELDYWTAYSNLTAQGILAVSGPAHVSRVADADINWLALSGLSTNTDWDNRVYPTQTPPRGLNWDIRSVMTSVDPTFARLLAGLTTDALPVTDLTTHLEERLTNLHPRSGDAVWSETVKWTPSHPVPSSQLRWSVGSGGVARPRGASGDATALADTPFFRVPAPDSVEIVSSVLTEMTIDQTLWGPAMAVKHSDIGAHSWNDRTLGQPILLFNTFRAFMGLPIAYYKSAIAAVVLHNKPFVEWLLSRFTVPSRFKEAVDLRLECYKVLEGVTRHPRHVAVSTALKASVEGVDGTVSPVHFVWGQQDEEVLLDRAAGIFAAHGINVDDVSVGEGNGSAHMLALLADCLEDVSAFRRATVRWGIWEQPNYSLGEFVALLATLGEEVTGASSTFPGLIGWTGSYSYGEGTLTMRGANFVLTDGTGMSDSPGLVAAGVKPALHMGWRESVRAAPYTDLLWGQAQNGRRVAADMWVYPLQSHVSVSSPRAVERVVLPVGAWMGEPGVTLMWLTPDRISAMVGVARQDRYAGAAFFVGQYPSLDDCPLPSAVQTVNGAQFGISSAGVVMDGTVTAVPALLRAMFTTSPGWFVDANATIWIVKPDTGFQTRFVVERCSPDEYYCFDDRGILRVVDNPETTFIDDADSVLPAFSAKDGTGPGMLSTVRLAPTAKFGAMAELMPVDVGMK